MRKIRLFTLAVFLFSAALANSQTRGLGIQEDGVTSVLLKGEKIWVLLYEQSNSLNTSRSVRATAHYIGQDGGSLGMLFGPQVLTRLPGVSAEGANLISSVDEALQMRVVHGFEYPLRKFELDLLTKRATLSIGRPGNRNVITDGVTSVEYTTSDGITHRSDLVAANSCRGVHPSK